MLNARGPILQVGSVVVSFPQCAIFHDLVREKRVFMPQPCLVFTRDTADSPPGIPPDQTMVGPMSGICEVVTQFWPVAGGLHFISKIIGRQEQEHKSDNFKYNMLEQQNDCLIYKVVIALSNYYFDRLKIKQCVAGLDLGTQNFFFFIFVTF